MTHHKFTQFDRFEEVDKETTIWRYMDFTKFSWLMFKKKLHFHRADEFSDPFEGSTPANIVEARNSIYNEVEFTDISDDVMDQNWPKRLTESVEYFCENMPSIHSTLNKRLKKFTFLNCWHLNRNESAAMWEIYGQQNKAIAIKTTYGKLIECLEDSETKYDIVTGKVNYETYEESGEKSISEDKIPDDLFLHKNLHTLSPFFMKRKSFFHEKELRAIIQRPPTIHSDEDITDLDYNMVVGDSEEIVPLRINDGVHGQKRHVDTTRDPKTTGLNVEIEIANLIDEIYVSPNAEDFFIEAIEEIAEQVEDINPKEDIKPSRMDREPLH